LQIINDVPSLTIEVIAKHTYTSHSSVIRRFSDPGKKFSK